MKLKNRSTCWMIQHKHKGFLKGISPWNMELTWTNDVIWGYRFKTMREAEIFIKKMYKEEKSGYLSQTHPIKVNAQKEDYHDRLPKKEWPHWRPSVVREMNKIRKIQKRDINLFPEMEEYSTIYEE